MRFQNRNLVGQVLRSCDADIYCWLPPYEIKRRLDQASLRLHRPWCMMIRRKVQSRIFPKMAMFLYNHWNTASRQSTPLAQTFDSDDSKLCGRPFPRLSRVRTTRTLIWLGRKQCLRVYSFASWENRVDALTSPALTARFLKLLKSLLDATHSPLFRERQSPSTHTALMSGNSELVKM